MPTLTLFGVGSALGLQSRYFPSSPPQHTMCLVGKWADGEREDEEEVLGSLRLGCAGRCRQFYPVQGTLKETWG